MSQSIIKPDCDYSYEKILTKDTGILVYSCEYLLVMVII